MFVSLVSPLLVFQAFQGPLRFFKGLRVGLFVSLCVVLVRNLTGLVKTQNFLFIQRFILQQRFSNYLMLFTVRFQNMEGLFMPFVQDPANFFIYQCRSLFRVWRLVITLTSEDLTRALQLNWSDLIAHPILGYHGPGNLGRLLKVI